MTREKLPTKKGTQKRFTPTKSPANFNSAPNSDSNFLIKLASPAPFKRQVLALKSDLSSHPAALEKVAGALLISHGPAPAAVI